MNSLGNFVLLTQSENASISDKPWESYKEVPGQHKKVVGKKEFYGGVSSAGAREVARSKGSWNAYHVWARGSDLFKKLAKQLDVDISKMRKKGLNINKALGFSSKKLKNTQFPALKEACVAKLAPDKAAARKKHEETTRRSRRATSDNISILFWTKFYEWCRGNDQNFARRIERHYDTDSNYIEFGRKERDYQLRFKRAYGFIGVDIYADEDVNGNKVESQRKNVETMNRLWQFHIDIETELNKNSDTIECHWELQQPSPREVKHRKAIFRRHCNIKNPEETFRLMVADAEKLVEVLNQHGENIQ